MARSTMPEVGSNARWGSFVSSANDVSTTSVGAVAGAAALPAAIEPTNRTSVTHRAAPLASRRRSSPFAVVVVTTFPHRPALYNECDTIPRSLPTIVTIPSADRPGASCSPRPVGSPRGNVDRLAFSPGRPAVSVSANRLGVRTPVGPGRRPGRRPHVIAQDLFYVVFEGSLATRRVRR